jgi:hypothetical protein
MYNPLVGMTGATTFATAAPEPAIGSGAGVTGQYVIDGTPVRVAALGLGAAIALAALRWAGFKFNVGVS